MGYRTQPPSYNYLEKTYFLTSGQTKQNFCRKPKQPKPKWPKLAETECSAELHILAEMDYFGRNGLFW